MPVMKNGKLHMFYNRGYDGMYPFCCGFYSGWFMETVMERMGLPKPSKYWAEAYPEYEKAWAHPDFIRCAEAVEDSLFGAF